MFIAAASDWVAPPSQPCSSSPTAFDMADAIAVELGLDEPTAEIRVYSRFVLQMQLFVNEHDDQLGILDAGFSVLENGWAPVEAALTASED